MVAHGVVSCLPLASRRLQKSGMPLSSASAGCQNRRMLVCAVLSLSLTQPPTETLPAVPYPDAMHAALDEATPKWLKSNAQTLRTALKNGPAVVVLEAEVSADGAVPADRLILPSGNKVLDDAARTFIIATEPLPPPDAVWLGEAAKVECVVRLRFDQARRKPTMANAVACLQPGQTVGVVAGMLPGMVTAPEASARLFVGWSREARGDDQGAVGHYRAAVRDAPAWDLATRALGLVLVKAKKVARAIPYLKTYVEARSGAKDALQYAREIARYDKVMAERIAEENRVRARLSKKDIAWGIKKGYPLLEPCLRRAREARALAVGVDTLVLAWKVRKDGSAHSARVEAPASLMMSEHADCISDAVGAWRFPKYSEGSEITVTKVPIKVRGSPKPRPKVVVAGNAAGAAAPVEESIDEPMFAECERSPEEIGGHIRSRQSRMRACILAERSRNPRVPMPDDLPITFVLDSAGPVRNIAIAHRAYRTGGLASCIAMALAGSLSPSKGADCPAEFSVDLRGLLPERSH